MPISALLTRIRKLIPCGNDDHYDQIVRGFGNSALRPPSRPMRNRELSSLMVEFLEDAPSVESTGTLSDLGHRERNASFRPSLPKRYFMPVWMEVLINVIGYAGFVGVATFNHSNEETDARGEGLS